MRAQPSGPNADLRKNAEVQTDSIHSTVHLPLLPLRISFGEHLFWGEKGLFRSVGIVAPLTNLERRNELTLRRTMLMAHQIGGFVTLGLMVTASYFGQKVIDDPSNRNLPRVHEAFVGATLISYSATGLLSVLSPPPSIRRDEFSTTTIHKTLAWIHLSGMIITPMLGGMIEGRSRERRERVHQISGYITTAIFAASMIIVTF
jgi:hypothetical protein